MRNLLPLIWSDFSLRHKMVIKQIRSGFVRNDAASCLYST